MEQPDIFDRKARRLRRDRAAADFDAHSFLVDHVAGELADRLASVTRPFARMLILGSHDGRYATMFAAPGRTIVSADPGFGFAWRSSGIQCDEDRLPFADGSFDLVVAIGGLDSVNDLPGALVLIRRALRPDGLFLGAFPGAGSLAWLRTAVLEADSLGGAVSPRIHPQIDVRSTGDLLSRASFTLPVADGEHINVGYPDPIRLIEDLRGMGQTNTLVSRGPIARGRAWLAALFERFNRDAQDDGRLRESFEIVYLTGWAPAPDQPKPARRGSGTASLANVLKPPSR